MLRRTASLLFGSRQLEKFGNTYFNHSLHSVPHPCAFFLAQGWETTQSND
jgi:hypothetical protein